jgi:dethiobiotin synthetase
MRLAECSFIGRNENLLITGSTGIGKSYVASAIGHQACIMGYRVLYASTPKLFCFEWSKDIVPIYFRSVSNWRDFLFYTKLQPFKEQSSLGNVLINCRLTKPYVKYVIQTILLR